MEKKNKNFSRYVAILQDCYSKRHMMDKRDLYLRVQKVIREFDDDTLNKLHFEHRHLSDFIRKLAPEAIETAIIEFQESLRDLRDRFNKIAEETDEAMAYQMLHKRILTFKHLMPLDKAMQIFGYDRELMNGFLKVVDRSERIEMYDHLEDEEPD